MTGRWCGEPPVVWWLRAAVNVGTLIVILGCDVHLSVTEAFVRHVQRAALRRCWVLELLGVE